MHLLCKCVRKHFAISYEGWEGSLKLSGEPVNLHQIYHLLLAGKVLEIPFATIKEAETFRVKLARLKARQDRELVSLGMLEEGQRQTLSFRVQGQLLSDAAPLTATIAFKDKVTQRQFAVRIVEDDEGTEAGNKQMEEGNGHL